MEKKNKVIVNDIKDYNIIKKDGKVMYIPKTLKWRTSKIVKEVRKQIRWYTYNWMETD